MKKKLSDLFLGFPEGRIKNSIRLLLYKAAAKKFFTVSYRIVDDVWIVKQEGVELKFKKNPYHVFSTNPLFLQFFPDWKPDAIVDAGAFHGTVGIHLAKKYPTAKVFMLEPDPSSFSILEENVRLNQLTNVELLKKGLWNQNGVIQFEQGNELSSSVARAESSNTISIETITPSSLLEGYSGKHIFFKMNIEGAELEAVPACLSLWECNTMCLAVSTDHRVNGDYTYKQIEAFCQEHQMPCKTEHVDIYKTTYIHSRTTK